MRRRVGAAADHQADLADDLPTPSGTPSTLSINAHSVAKFRLSRAVRDAGYKVVLTGEGSDEILAGYPHFRRDMLLYDRKGQDPREVERLLAELTAANAVSRGILMPDSASAGAGPPSAGPPDSRRCAAGSGTSRASSRRPVPVAARAARCSRPTTSRRWAPSVTRSARCSTGSTCAASWAAGRP